MTYSYTLTGLSALGITDLSLTYRSLEEDTASLRCPLRAGAEAPPLPWAEGDRIILCDDREAGSPRLFNGRVSRLNTTLSGTSYELNIELTNDVHVLNATTYAMVDASDNVRYAQSFYEPRADRESRDGERLSSVRNVCNRCVAWALSGGVMDCRCEVDIDAIVMGVAGSGSQSCWSLMLTALKWVPDACTAMRYSNEGDVFSLFTARDAGEVTLDLATGQVTASGTTLCTFEGITALNLTPRPDLIPPVCALTGRKQLVLPPGGDVREPGAFVYHVRERENPSASSGGRAQTAAARQAVTDMAPRQTVCGRYAPLLPTNAIGDDIAMRDDSELAPAKWLAWLGSFPEFALLRKIGLSNLAFGNPMFEPVSASEAYPSAEASGDSSITDTLLDVDASSDDAPANYDDPATWNKLYLLVSGTFPASVEPSRNLSGLKWCRGKLSQYVWIKPGALIPSSLSKERLLEFFHGSHPAKDASGKKVNTRYALLTIEGIWINQRRTRYAEGTNQPDGAEDSANSGGGGGGGETADADPPYESALLTFYHATRKLYHDGSITLTGLRGNPGALLGANLNITGLQPAWGTMQTPINAITYDPIARTATLELGSRDNISMSELLERQGLGSLQADSRRAGGGASNPQDTTPDVDDNAAGDNEEEEEVEMIAPSITAAFSAGVGGKTLKPFQVYPEGDRYYLNGGTIKTSTGYISTDPIDITEAYAPNRRFYAREGKTPGTVVVRWVSTATNS